MISKIPFDYITLTENNIRVFVNEGNNNKFYNRPHRSPFSDTIFKQTNILSTELKSTCKSHFWQQLDRPHFRPFLSHPSVLW